MTNLISKISLFCLFFISVSSKARQDNEFLNGTFPEGFLFGFATSSYQIEGAWDADGKGLNIWDTFSHENNGSNINDGSNGDVACDSYNKYLDDVQLLKDTGANFYRFSISWARILPTGSATELPLASGIAYYNKLIDALLENGITPFVTMYHWDLPQALEDIGGWPNEAIAYNFGHYATILYREFGDRVKDWITFNEPWVVCQLGYAYGSHAPGISDQAETPYKCAHTIIKSHGLAYRIYEAQFKQQQGGQVGITLNTDWAEPSEPDNQEHIDASDRSLRFAFGWFANPLYRGEYHPIMRQLVDEKSQAEGRNTSRLPSFDEEWTRTINGTLDFIGLNHYTTNYVFPTDGGAPGLDGDKNTGGYADPEWEESAADWLRVVPWGFRKIVNWITKEYDRPPIYVTENGYADRDVDGVQDTGRVNYYRRYINELMKAVLLDNADVRAYTAWSLIDNYEWAAGYTQRFGTHYINFMDPNLTRVPKDSAIFLKQVFADNGFPNGPN